jgi:hypothetical protein
VVRKLLLVFLFLTFFVNLLTTYRSVRAGNILLVPDDYSTIQAAIDAAVTDDVIIISPGTYVGYLLIDGKAITLTSEFSTTGNPLDVRNTIIAGSASFDPKNPGDEPVIRIGTEKGTKINLETTIQGLTLKNGSDGVKTFNNVVILDNYITNTHDAIDLTNAGAIIKRNLIEFNKDDAIDFDFASYGLVENNILFDNNGDGIEMRFHEYTGPTLNIIIRNNQIIHNNSDGIQLIRDWIEGEPVSNRILTIEKNLIYDNGQAGLGLMDGGITNEDYRAASLLERIHVFNNTIIDHEIGVSGGDNMVVINNIIANSKTLGIKNIDGNSIVAYNLMWNNVINSIGSNIDPLHPIINANPLLDANYALLVGSPAINAGTAYYEHLGSPVLNYPSGSYYGLAPDLGWKESNFNPIPGGYFVYLPSILTE